MKKCILFFAACLAATVMRAAVTTALSCGFEVSEGWDGSFADGWSTELVSWGDEVFNLYTDDAHTGSQCIRITAGEWAAEDAYLNFPSVDFGEEEVECTITFWAKTTDGAVVYFGTGEVAISGSEWTQYSYSMTVTGETQLQFDGYVEDGSILYIDDFEVTYDDATPVEPATPVYLTLPYSEGFEAAGNALLPEGWTVITDREWNLQRYSLGNQHSGSWYLSFNYGNPVKYAVLPLYPDSLSSLTISLWHKTRDYYGSGQLTVGVMSDPADASTFRTIRVLPCTATAQAVTGVYRQATVDLASAPADCHYIALRYAGGNGGQDDMLYVDDIEVFLTPVTPAPDPVDPDPVDPDPVDPDPVNPDPGTDPGSDPGSDPTPVGNGLFFDFEDASADTLWHYLHPDVNRWIIGNDMLDADRQYTRALYISNDGTYFDYNYRLAQVAWAWTAVSVDTDTLYSISFDYNCYGEYNTDYFLLMLVADSFGLPAAPNSAYYAGLDMTVSYAACHDYMPAGATLLTDFMPTGSNEWRTHTCRRWLYPGRYYLVAFWTNDNDYGVFPAALDNIFIGRQPRPNPDSALSDTEALSLPVKIIRDGQLLILRGGCTYDAQGRILH